MKMKNDCERDYIKKAFDKLYNCVMPFIDLTQFDDADTAFKELDQKVHSEIYILKKCLAESDRAVKALKEENDSLRIVIDGLEKENANLRVTPPDVNVIESLEKENSELKTSNERLNAKYKSHWKALSEARTEAALMKKENSYMRRINDHLAATCEARSKLLSEAREEVEQYKKSFMVDHEENNRLREVIDGRDNDIHDLEEENASLTEDVDALVAENTDLHTKLSDDEIRIKSLKRANSVLRRDNGILWSKMEECDLDIFKRPWHGDGNAMTGERTCYKSLVEAIEFQNKKIEELEAEKARLKEAYETHETTIKEHKENEVPTGDHEFRFGDKVFVPWSDGPYMYVKSGMMYNPRTKSLVYVGKDQHLKWFGDKFSIV